MNNGQQFLEFALHHGALRFGHFELKSGRVSPYFFNLGVLHNGATLQQVGSFYAAAIHHAGMTFDLLFGPAYKGIPLVSVTALSLIQNFGVDTAIAFNRKEAKDHGEGGAIVGAALAGKVVVLDDVITAGTAIRESFALIQAAGAQVAGVVIAFDRQEKGANSDQSIVTTLQEEYAIPVICIATFAQLMDWIRTHPEQADIAALESYRQTYGA